MYKIYEMYEIYEIYEEYEVENIWESSISVKESKAGFFSGQRFTSLV